MASASYTMFSVLYYYLLLFLFLIHETQSCPKSIYYSCPDHAYDTGKTSLEFPFTNISQPDCGGCVLTCNEDTNHTEISCRSRFGEPMPTYKEALSINPSNRTMAVVAYPDELHLLDDINKYPCKANEHPNASFPTTPSVSFTLLEGFQTFIICSNESTSLNWDNSQYHPCEDDYHRYRWIYYGPYEDDHIPKTLLPLNCTSVQLPNPNYTNFTIQYNISNQCQSCLAEGGLCHDDADVPGGVYCIHRDKSKRKLAIILGTVLPGSVIILGALLFVYWRQGKKKSGSSTSASRSLSFNRIRTDLEVGTVNGVTVYSYTELEEATNNFDPAKHLGEGGFGVVYHGKLRDGREVAVKRLYEKSYKRIEQFKNEIRILTDLRHQYLVTLYGCTSRHTRELLLVYEYIPNGTVADHLHGEKTKSRLLPWPTRMSIAIETATALSYLHFNDIIHRDVKTNNILLDNSFSVKVADFGLSRLFPADVTHVSTAPQGTPGYVDPEYHQCYHLTDKSDVYSFGVVLVELISSLLAVDVGRDRHEINLSTYAMNRIQASALSDLIDPDLGFETNFKVRRMTTLVAELASQCLQHDRELRPSMEEVLEILKKIESEDYDALEAEEANWSTGTTDTPKPPPSPTDNDGIELLRNTRQPPLSPISVMNKWVSSSKSTTSKFSYTSNSS